MTERMLRRNIKRCGIEVGAMTYPWQAIWCSSAGLAAATFVLTLVTLHLLDPIARRAGLVDRPGGRKTHSDPTPLIGGLAILVGSLPFAAATFELTPSVIGLVLAAIIIVGAGILDDLSNLRWYVRMAAQIAAACALVYVGDVSIQRIGPLLGADVVPVGAWSAPLTVLATVGLMNAINMSDGLDGLAGSLTLTALVMLTACAMYSGNHRLGHGLLLLLGALSAFLAFNLRTPWRPTARVFLGNAGSEFLGLVVAWASFRVTQNVEHPVAPALVLFFVAPVVIDCLVLMVRRLRNGVSPFAADRNHLHHLLVDAGWSTTGVVLLICGASAFAGLAAALGLRAGVPPIFLLGAFSLMTVAYYLISAKRQRCLQAFSALHRARHAALPPLSLRSP